MEIEKFIELLKKLDQLEKYSEAKQDKLLNYNELQEAYHNRSLQKLEEIENLQGKTINNLNNILKELIELNDFIVSNGNIFKNSQVLLSNIDISIQASNAKFDRLLEIIECTEAYKEFQKAKEVQKEAESNEHKAEIYRQTALTIRVDDFEKFPLRKKVYMCLLRHRIKCIGDILKYSEKGLYRLEGMGPISIKEIKELLAQYNFRLMTQ